MFASELSTKERDELAEKIARKVVDLKLSIPAIVFLESSKPLSYLGNQLMVFFQPIIGTFLPNSEFYNKLIAFFENRENIEVLIQKIEELEEESDKKRRN